jgi:UDP-2-acetamido-3-amino-2,3-dideoxy-glucuronate N-acetyltransferase
MSEYGQRLEFDESGVATCSESGEKYKLTGNTVSRI